MRLSDKLFRLSRRRFAFWVGMGLFGLAEKLRAGGLDEFAASLMRRTEPKARLASATSPEHWVATGNKTWRWYERETLVDGKWKVTGITTPVHKSTGEQYVGRGGYLDEALVPIELRSADREKISTSSAVVKASAETEVENGHGHADPTRRARHGRPPSKWLRSLHADELRIWLKTIDPPEAGVSGMTFFEHLTRDHSFDAAHITGLTIDEQAKLHAAAHDGY